MAVIYRIRNLISGKCYIGESKKADPFGRWNQHKRAIERGAGCPALRDAVRKYGIENFVFEILIFCFDEDRFHYEKEYIRKYNTQVPNGYNITAGGEGGGFVGKTHTQESIAKIQEKMQKYYKDPEYIAKASARATEQMKHVNMSETMRNSIKFKNAIEEGRVGAASHKKKKTKEELEEIYKKVSDSLKEYYKNNKKQIVNIEKHRKSMAKAKGIPVGQYSKEGVLIASFQSISDAARTLNVHKYAIQRTLDNANYSSTGFLWKTLKRENDPVDTI
jgi:group I intron endonuclease